jgi:hypothetical protein
MRPRLCLTALALALVAPTSASAMHTSSHLPAYGMGTHHVEWLAGGPDWVDPNGLADLQLAGSRNIGLNRTRFRRDQVRDPATGAYSRWAQLDNLVRQSALRSVTTLPILINMPNDVYAPPRTSTARNALGGFAAAAVRRYGPGGSFWTSCDCPKTPIKVWEVWAEPNRAAFWQPTPAPAEYGMLLKTVRSKVRQADPTARILHATLFYNPGTEGNMDANAFLRQVIAAVGWRQFDAVGVEAYTLHYPVNPQTAVNVNIRATVDTLRTYGGTSANGAPRHQVWVSKLSTPGRADAESEASQAAFYDETLALLLPNRSQWNLGPVLAYTLRDLANPAPGDDWARLGMRRTKSDGSDDGAKPAWGEFIERACGGEPVNGACPAPASHLNLPAVR